MILNENDKLNSGYDIPKIAIGTWQVSNEEVVDVVKSALSIGYRHIDTAVDYKNEEGVGKAIKESGIAREELFVTTKIPSGVKNYEDAKRTIEESLKRLDTGYIDLMLIHSPKPWNELFNGSENNYFKENLEVWKAMEEAVQEGKIKSIGVSNFEIEDIQNIIDHAKIKPAVNEIRVHIGHAPKEVIDYCKENEILILAFSPNATGKLLNHPVVSEIAQQYNVSIPQLSIRFDYQLGLLPLPRSKNPQHIAENKEIDFEISKEDMARLLDVEEIQSLDM